MATTSQPALPSIIADVVDEAIARRHRPDAALPGTGGPAGNARLTAWTGLLLLVVILAELVTLLDVNGLIDWHVGLGAAVLVLVVLKTATTGYRMTRYYAGNEHYKQSGPPPLLLRLLGPLVVVSTATLVASGVVLVSLGRSAERGSIAPFLPLDWLTLHQVSFIVFAVAAGLHVLARLIPALRLTVAPGIAGNTGDSGIDDGGAGDSSRADRHTVAGGRARLAIIALTVVAAAGTAAVIISITHGWGGGGFHSGRHLH